MTKDEIDQVIKLQARGFGYRKIAAETGISSNAVRGFCRKHPEYNGEKIPYEIACKHCGIKIKIQPGRRPKIFCSDACRIKYWNANPDLRIPPKKQAFRCKHCNQLFYEYASRAKAYCSKQCMFADRRQNPDWRNTAK